MDEEDELRQFKRIMIAVVCFLISAYFSYQELKYAVWGTMAEATVTRTFETADMGRRGRRQPRLAVEYTFTDVRTGPRSERDDVSIDWSVPQGTVDVQYLPGVPDSSRLKGNSSQIAVWIFFACLAWLGYSGYQLYREANSPIPTNRRRRR